MKSCIGLPSPPGYMKGDCAGQWRAPGFQLNHIHRAWASTSLAQTIGNFIARRWLPANRCVVGLANDHGTLGGADLVDPSNARGVRVGVARIAQRDLLVDEFDGGWRTGRIEVDSSGACLPSGIAGVDHRARCAVRRGAYPAELTQHALGPRRVGIRDDVEVLRRVFGRDEIRLRALPTVEDLLRVHGGDAPEIRRHHRLVAIAERVCVVGCDHHGDVGRWRGIRAVGKGGDVEAQSRRVVRRVTRRRHRIGRGETVLRCAARSVRRRGERAYARVRVRGSVGGSAARGAGD